MINGYSAEQVRTAEAPHLAAGEPLMQRAAAGLTEQIRRVLMQRSDVAGPVLLLIGSGDNGGDALYAGAELAAGGVRVSFLATGSRVHEHGLAAALESGAQQESSDPAHAAQCAADAAVIVDGILGTGTSVNPALRGTAREIVAAIIPVIAKDAGTSAGLGGRPSVVAVDIPSGINPNDGSVPDPVVLRADVTVTFGGYKAGLLLDPGSEYAGEIRLIDIGLGPDLEKLEPLIRVPE